jgi:S-formylglutathione hydrolase
MSIELVSQAKSFGGWHKQYTHYSNQLNCVMRFAVYLPPQAGDENKVPVIYWLSGLTCNDENFMQKAGAHRIAAELGVALVAPDTSPRGEGVPDDDEAAYDFGLGAGFYLNASQAPWHKHYKMYDYIVKELPDLVESYFPVTQQRAISGHSMGGHGALTIGLKNPDRYVAISAFSPICNPVRSPWGKKAFANYLGPDAASWQEYDASVLMAVSERHLPTLVDQGEEDGFLKEQLMPEALEIAAFESNYPLTLRRHHGYDHSYYFIATFIEDHLRFLTRHF